MGKPPCQIDGCPKGAAEGGKPFCIRHGGGRRCTWHLGCTKSAVSGNLQVCGLLVTQLLSRCCRQLMCSSQEGGHAFPKWRSLIEESRSLIRVASVATVVLLSLSGPWWLPPYQVCKAHGGGKRCTMEGCQKSAVPGGTPHCSAHGGGKRCQTDGCSKGVQGGTKFCSAHGGGRRCQTVGCPKGAAGSGTNHCIAHGGGRRCRFLDCNTAARGTTDLCIAHGGGRRCKMDGCSKSAIAGAVELCMAHGGGRRCQFDGCSKSISSGGGVGGGGINYCVAHGGRQCQMDGCSKPLQAGSAFCASHARCGYNYCPSAAHGGTAFCLAHGRVGALRCQQEGCDRLAHAPTPFCAHCLPQPFDAVDALQLHSANASAADDDVNASFQQQVESAAGPSSPLPPVKLQVAGGGV
jgi:hypothetical protein